MLNVNSVLDQSFQKLSFQKLSFQKLIFPELVLLESMISQNLGFLLSFQISIQTLISYEHMKNAGHDSPWTHLFRQVSANMYVFINDDDVIFVAIH